MDKLTVYEVESAGSAGVSLKNITLHRGPDGALLDGRFERNLIGLWMYTGGVMRDGSVVAQVASLHMSPWASGALDEVWRRVQAEPFKLASVGDAFFIDGLPSGRVAVIRSTPEDDDAPDLVRAHLPGYPLIGSNGPTMAAAAVGVLHSLRAHAAGSGRVAARVRRGLPRRGRADSGRRWHRQRHGRDRGDVGGDAERVSQRGAHRRGRGGGGEGEDDMTEQADHAGAPVQAGGGMIFAGGGVE